jgi:hypothetical protein
MSKPLSHDLWNLLRELFSSALFGFVWILALGAFTEFSVLWGGAYGLSVLALFIFVHIIHSDIRTRATIRLRPISAGTIVFIAGATVELLITMSSVIWRANQSAGLSGEPGGMEVLRSNRGDFWWFW